MARSSARACSAAARRICCCSCSPAMPTIRRIASPSICNRRTGIRFPTCNIRWWISAAAARARQELWSATLRRLGATPAFMTAASEPSIPRLDFVRGGIIDPNKFKDLPTGANPLRQTFEKALADAAAAEKSGVLVAVFGTGYPADPQTGGSVPTGFTGIENIHMNQGAYNLINGEPYYRENGPNQDGGIILLSPDGARGFFVKFRAQTVETDPQGNPTVTGIDEIDRTSAAVRKAIMPRIRRRALAARRKDARTSAKHAARTRPASTTAAPLRAATPSSRTPASGTSNSQGFLFADFDPERFVRQIHSRRRRRHLQHAVRANSVQRPDEGAGADATQLSAHGFGVGRRRQSARLCRQRRHQEHRLRHHRRQRRADPEEARRIRDQGDGADDRGRDKSAAGILFPRRRRGLFLRRGELLLQPILRAVQSLSGADLRRSRQSRRHDLQRLHGVARTRSSRRFARRHPVAGSAPAVSCAAR